ncbi:hypothetical protein [Desulfonatronum thiodismutans]|uniref:hypothetical protein n=1 Tax=Desulfonatronum thiodismutans TaxID=159290 RepID=UPI001268624C|nr:hypothetical protein [Desulfonatronum thiodismutans]
MNKDNLRIGLLTCIWKRHNLTNIVLNYYKKLQNDLMKSNIELELVAVGSEKDVSKKLSLMNNFDYVEAPNTPLGSKWNAGCLKMQEKQVDATVIVGSDDLLNKEIFLLYKECLLGSALYIGFTQLYFYELQSGKILLWKGYNDGRNVKTIGLGRCIHKSYLEMLNWKLWSDNIDCGLDKNMTERLSTKSYFIENLDKHLRFKCESNPFFPLDIKTDLNMWSYSQIKNLSENIEFDEDGFISNIYTDNVYNSLIKLRKRLLSCN